jgi:hypothetical protein
MTTSEKNTLIEWATHEVDARLKAVQRASPYKDTPKLFRALGECKEAERVLKNLRLLLRKL